MGTKFQHVHTSKTPASQQELWGIALDPRALNKKYTRVIRWQQLKLILNILQLYQPNSFVTVGYYSCLSYSQYGFLHKTAVVLVLVHSAEMHLVLSSAAQRDLGFCQGERIFAYDDS